jgi:hypothetical protein
MLGLGLGLDDIAVSQLNSAAPGVLALDGSAYGGAPGAPTAVLTTTLTDDVIVAIVAIAGGGTVSSFTGVSGWQQRKAVSWTSGESISVNLEVWWTTSATALDAQSIKANISGDANDALIMVFGVNGADLTSPWDANASLPATATGSSGVPSAPVSTSAKNTMLIGATAIYTGTAQSQGRNFALILAETEGELKLTTEYQIVSTRQNDASVGSSADAVTAFYVIADALKAA